MEKKFSIKVTQKANGYFGTILKGRLYNGDESRFRKFSLLIPTDSKEEEFQKSLFQLIKGYEWENCKEFFYKCKESRIIDWLCNDCGIEITKVIDISNRGLFYLSHLVYGKIWNKDRNVYKKFRLILNHNFDELLDWCLDEERIEELQEEYNKKVEDDYTFEDICTFREYCEKYFDQEMIRLYEKEIIINYSDYIKSFNDCKEFFEICRRTLDEI